MDAMDSERNARRDIDEQIHDGAVRNRVLVQFPDSVSCWELFEYRVIQLQKQIRPPMSYGLFVAA